MKAIRSPISISSVPDCAVIESVTIGWNVNSNYIGDIAYNLQKPSSSYISSLYQMNSTGTDSTYGYLQDSTGYTILHPPKGIAVNGDWYFSIVDYVDDYNSFYNRGMIDSWGIQISYDDPKPKFSWEMFMPAILSGIKSSPPDDHGDDCTSATLITANSRTPGRIDRVDDIDVFKVKLTVPGTLTIFSTDSSTILHGRLYDENNNVIVQGKGSAADFDFRVSAPLNTGSYYIFVGSLVAGHYTLVTEFKENNGGETGIPTGLSPCGGSSVITYSFGAKRVTFSWNVVPGATYYTFNIDEPYESFTMGSSSFGCDAQRCTFTHYLSKRYDGLVHWRVKAAGSGWSELCSFWSVDLGE